MAVIDLPDAGEVTGTSVGFDFDGNGLVDHDADPLTPDVPGNDVEADQFVVYYSSTCTDSTELSSSPYNSI